MWVGAAGLIAIAIGVLASRLAVGLIGGGFVVMVVILAVMALPMRRPRLLLVRGRVLRIQQSTADSGAEMVIALRSVKRLRPDGLVRHIPTDAAPRKLGTSDEVYEELCARPQAWSDRAFVAGNDYFVLASFETVGWAVRRRGR